MRSARSILPLLVAGALVLSALLLAAGCGGGPKADSLFQGAYRASYAIPDLDENGTFSFSIDQEGRMVGSFVDARTNQTRGFSGTVNNAGGFSGQRSEPGGTSFPVTGVFAGAGSSGVGTSGGDFRLTQNGVSRQGSFTVVTGGSPTLPTFESAFQGAYTLAWSLPGRNQSGTTSFSVDARGAITGLFTRASETGLFTGAIGNNGHFEGTIAYPSGAAALAGTLAPPPANGGAPPAAGTTVGNFTQSENGASVPGVLSIPTPPPPAAPPSPFAGTYRGNYSLPGAGERGSVNFTIDPSGVLTGSFVSGARVGSFSAAVAGDGTFSGTITFGSGQTQEVRSIAGKMAALGGGGSGGASPAGVAGDFVQTVTGALQPGTFEASIAATGPGTDSNFLGAYDGSWSNAALGETGTFQFTIDAEGQMLGSFRRENGRTGNFAGSVTAAGRWSGVVNYPDGERVTLDGVMALNDAKNRINGNYTEFLAGVAYDVTFTGARRGEPGA